MVLSEDFFLSPQGRSDPRAELIATIRAYFTPWGENANEHARCRFPARYFWLSQQLSLPGYNLRETGCQRLEKWAQFDSVKSISVLLVSGYLGNPASTFGHAILKLNTDSSDDQSGLFDLTLNYGATVPENENALLYIARGLFGGYKAGFSDKYYYTKDLVYSRTEFRDIWDYRLELTDYERTLLILHIWEIVGKKFDYYFLDKNCAYRLAELLDLVIDEDLINKKYYWYLPVELFYRLKEIDQDRHVSSRAGLIHSVRFIPSSQRTLYRQVKLLTPAELEAFNVIIREGPKSIQERLGEFASDRRIDILDGLLAYQQYRLVGEEPNPSHSRREFKDQLLLARLQLPARSKSLLEVPELSSPADGSRPLEMGVSIASEFRKNPFTLLHWSPFKADTVGKNSLEGDELVVFDFDVGIADDDRKVFIDQFDLARVLNLNMLSVPVADENLWSWKFRVGMDRIRRDADYYYDGVVSFGPGRAWKLSETITGYGLVDLAGHTLSPYARVRPHLGVRCELGEFRTSVYFGAESITYDGRFRDIWGGKVQYQLNNRAAVHVEISNEKATRASAGISLYW